MRSDKALPRVRCEVRCGATLGPAAHKGDERGFSCGLSPCTPLPGKTTLIRALTGDTAIQPRDQLFATLDVTAHAGSLPSRMTVIYMDTIGFLSQLPHSLIEAFSATLEDVAHSVSGGVGAGSSVPCNGAGSPEPQHSRGQGALTHDTSRGQVLSHDIMVGWVPSHRTTRGQVPSQMTRHVLDGVPRQPG